MDEHEYFLRCSVHAHSLDVRAVKVADVPLGGIVSGSRDRTIKVWTPNETDPGYTETHCMMGPTHFISSVCTLPPSAQYPCGLILAGSNDCAIYGFSLESSQPILKLLGHSGTVCCLVAGNFGTVVSGSWDKTARVWLGQKCVMVLEGHQEAVWAVEMFRDQGLTLTGSADKSIRLWRAGNCEKIFNGHEDCVRGLAVLSSLEFLSCANDCTVRLWQTNGNCMQVYHGHTDYIYSIDILNRNGHFVTCSEDQTLKLWKEGVCSQTLKLPAKSLWAVACLKNEDIVVGGSDGTIHVFTKHKDLKATPEQLAEFEKELSVPQKKEMIGDLKVDELPDFEILKAPGLKDGQTTVCRDGDTVSVYQWSSTEQKWSKLGDVIDANAGSGSSTKKKTKYEGKEYDYVFTIDVEEGKYLKLPYDVTDNPWLVAQTFIERHNLNQVFLDQIANFIITNSQDSMTRATAQISDPFTGENRYIPFASTDSSSVEPGDPPAQNGKTTKSSALEGMETENAFSPQSTYLRFDSANVDGLRNKLVEFSDLVIPSLNLSEVEIQQLLLLVNFPKEVTDQQMVSLEKVMSWPADYVFPALDLFRLAVRSEVINEKVGEAGGFLIANHLLKFLAPSNPPANKMLVLRTFCNFFGHSPGENLLKNHMEKIFHDANNCCKSPNKNIQIAVATLYLNYAVALNKSVVSDGSFISINAIEALNYISDSEALFRIMVCIGTLLENPSAKAAIKSVEIRSTLERLKKIEDSLKVKLCADYLLDNLQ